MNIRRRPPNPSIKVSNLEYAIPHSKGEPQNILEEIIWEKDKEVDIAKQRVPLDKMKSKISELPKPISFIEALQKRTEMPAVIAEVKKASPSRGVIRKDFNPVAIAKDYQEGGAACLSVLTDKKFFQGGFDVLVEVRKEVELPLLCKDFIITPYQIYQARAAGADAVLLIAAILSDQDLIYLRKIAYSLEMTILVEVHDSDEMERVISLGDFPLIGINNRDLKTFEVDLAVTERLAKKFKSKLNQSEVLLVSESGLFTREDLDRVCDCGAEAVLVGEALIKQEDIIAALKKLMHR